MSLLILAAVAANGCGFFRPHRPATLQVLDAETRLPISGAKISVRYPNMMDFSAPLPSRRTTDATGVANLKLTKYHMLDVSVEAEGYVSLLPSSSFVQGLYESGNALHTVAMWKGPRPKIELLVPDGYRGPVKVVCATGLPDDYALGQRLFQYRVDSNGRVVVRTPQFVDASTLEMTARYHGGAAIPSSTAGHSDIAFRRVDSGRGVNADTLLYIIGTETEEEILRQSVNTRLGPYHWTPNREAYERLFEVSTRN